MISFLPYYILDAHIIGMIKNTLLEVRFSSLKRIIVRKSQMERIYGCTVSDLRNELQR